MGVDVRIDGTAARLTDLSRTGAQLVAPMLLRPHQHVRIVLSDDTQVLRVVATVIRASLEPSRGADTPPRYRVGITFIDTNPKAVDVFCARIQQDENVKP